MKEIYNLIENMKIKRTYNKDVSITKHACCIIKHNNPFRNS